LTAGACNAAKAIVALYIGRKYGSLAADAVKKVQSGIPAREQPHQAWAREVIDENLMTMKLDEKVSRRDRFMWQL